MPLERLPTDVLDSWINGTLSSADITSMHGSSAWNLPVQGTTLLGRAIERNRLNLVNEALDQGANPNVANEDGIVPLRMTLYKKRPKMFLRLLEHPGLDHQAGRSEWNPQDADPRQVREGSHDVVALFFPSVAFDIARYANLTLAEAWNKLPEPGWSLEAPLPLVLPKRGSYHQHGPEMDHGHALDVALLSNRPDMAAWLIEHTSLSPSTAVLTHGYTFDALHRDEPPISPHPVKVLTIALGQLPMFTRPEERPRKQSIDHLAMLLRKTKKPWELASTASTLIEGIRLHQHLASQSLSVAPAANGGRKRL